MDGPKAIISTLAQSVRAPQWVSALYSVYTAFTILDVSVDSPIVTVVTVFICMRNNRVAMVTNCAAWIDQIHIENAKLKELTR